ncbi:MAG: TIGR04222 domain-containing membrane protein, partial [Nonomuraea sp.]|nr:TIGR04222 domain-containing membrane protein [Nonomuraea sp.]
MDVILLYLSAALGAVSVGTIVRIEWLRARAWWAPPWDASAELDYYQLAYLSGGPNRVIQTAVGLLTREGDLRVSRGGKLHRVAGAVSAGFPLEEAILAEVKTRKAGFPAVKLIGRVAAHPSVNGLGEALVRQGLLVDLSRLPGSRTALDLLRWIRLCTLGGMLVCLALMALFGSPPYVVGSLLVLGATWLLVKGYGRLYARRRGLVRTRAAGRIL